MKILHYIAHTILLFLFKIENVHCYHMSDEDEDEGEGEDYVEKSGFFGWIIDSAADLMASAILAIVPSIGDVVPSAVARTMEPGECDDGYDTDDDYAYSSPHPPSDGGYLQWITAKQFTAADPKRKLAASLCHTQSIKIDVRSYEGEGEGEDTTQDTVIRMSMMKDLSSHDVFHHAEDPVVCLEKARILSITLHGVSSATLLFTIKNSNTRKTLSDRRVAVSKGKWSGNITLFDVSRDCDLSRYAVRAAPGKEGVLEKFQERVSVRCPLRSTASAESYFPLHGNKKFDRRSFVAEWVARNPYGLDVQRKAPYARYRVKADDDAVCFDKRDHASITAGILEGVFLRIPYVSMDSATVIVEDVTLDSARKSEALVCIHIVVEYDVFVVPTVIEDIDLPHIIDE